MSEMTRGTIKCELDVQLCGGSIYTPDRWLYADETKAYVEAYISHAFPSVMAFGCALHPGTIANSFASLRDQNVNISHLIKSYNPDEIPRDRIIGSVVSSEFPPVPSGGWKVAKDTPGIRAVMAIFKQAAGVDRILGSQQAGRRKWSVSIEYTYSKDESGFLVSNKNLNSPIGMMQMQDTPSDIRGLDWWYVPPGRVTADLKACWSDKSERVVRQWNGADVVYLHGGINGQVHYQGIALTENPAEPSARIEQVLASDDNAELWAPLKSVVELCEKSLTL